MKKCLIVSVFAAVWMATCAFAVETDQIIFRWGPLDLERVVNPRRVGDKSSVPMISRWLAEGHRNAKIVGMRPIIKDNQLLGWEVDWEKSSSSPQVDAGYMEMEGAFEIPDGISSDDILKTIWKGLSKRMSQIGRCKPIALNITEKAGVRTVYGLWYLVDTRRYWVFKPDGRVTYQVNTEQLPALEREREAASGEIPITKELITLVTGDKELGIEEVVVPMNVGTMMNRLPVDSDEATVLAPFRVQGKWIDLQSVVNTDEKSPLYGKLLHLRVGGVTPRTPFAAAGVRKGDKVTHLQGIEVSLFTPEEFDSRLEAALIGDRLTMMTVDPFGRRRSISVVNNRTTLPSRSP